MLGDKFLIKKPFKMQNTLKFIIKNKIYFSISWKYFFLKTSLFKGNLKTGAILQYWSNITIQCESRAYYPSLVVQHIIHRNEKYIIQYII